MKIVVNKCYGGYSLSQRIVDVLGCDNCYAYEDDRTNPKLVEVVEKLGRCANGYCANLVVEEIPDNATDYYIKEYDGLESIIYVVDGKLHFIE